MLFNKMIRLDSIISLLKFLWKRKLWWLLPLIIMLIIVTLLVVIGQSSALSPFVYALF